MWLVAEFRRGPSATLFFSLAPTLIPVLSVLFFPPLFSRLVCSYCARGSRPYPAWTLSPGRNGARTQGCAAQLFGTPGTKLLARPSQTSQDLSFASSFASRRPQERNGCSVGLGVAGVGTWDPESESEAVGCVCGQMLVEGEGVLRIARTQFACVSPYPGARHWNTLQTGARGRGGCPTEGCRAGRLVGRGVAGGRRALGPGLL